MKTKHLLQASILLSLATLSCTKQVDGVMGSENEIEIPTIDANLMVGLRPSTLVEPMVWGGTYSDPTMDSIVLGSVSWDSTYAMDGDTLSENCKDPANWWTNIYYTPLYQSKEVFQKRIRSYTEDVELLNPGKLMVYKNWKFVTDVNRGVHIYNDTDPSNPVKVAFINVPGILDIALKNHTLYVNAYSALVAIDIEDPNKAFMTEFIPNAFPPVYQSWMGTYMDSLGNVAVAWQADSVHSCWGYRNGWEVDYDGVYAPVTGGPTSSSTSMSSSSTEVKLGKNGSMSRFAISSDWLYTVDNSSLRLFGIAQDAKPTKGTIVTTTQWDLETIFRDGSALFIGSMTGMSIYDISKADAPVFASKYSHITSCDPVVVQDGIAYVTLRSGNRCANGKNELNILDVKDIYNPTLLSTLPMTNPAGLAIEDSSLFVCEGSYGLAVIDIQNPSLPVEVSRVTNVTPEDVVADQGILTLIGDAGIWRMDYSDRKSLELLSFTEAEQPIAVPYIDYYE